jgi:hypothetical protein
MDYSKIATIGLRIFVIYLVFYGVTDAMYVLYKMRTGASVDVGYYGMMISFRFFVGLLLMRFSAPLARKLTKDIVENTSPTP